VHTTDDELRLRMACAEDTLVTARRRCISEGWIYYEPASLGDSSRIWVTIPQWVNLKMCTGVRSTNSTETSTKNSTETLTKNSTKNPPSYSPTTGINTHSHTPSENSEIAGAGEGEIEQLAKELLELGIGKPVEAATSGLSKLTLQQIRQHLDHFRSKPGAWGPVILYKRLVSPSLSIVPPNVGWPDPLPEFSAATSREQIESRSRREAALSAGQREEESKKRIAAEQARQLLIDWEATYGSVLDSMPEEEVLKLCPAGLREMCRKRKRSDPLIREVLLKILASQAG